jgi:predicted metalloprotease with PDZ domain
MRRLHALAAAIAIVAAVPQVAAQKLEPIVFTVRVADPDTHYIEVEAIVPAMGRASVDLMMPVWSPGYYRVEDYAANVHDIRVETARGRPLTVEKTNGNHWRVESGGEPSVRLVYRVLCQQRTVTTNYVDRDYGVLNGAPTFITLAEQARRPHVVQVELPPSWTRAMTGLEDAPGGGPNRFLASDYETLVDSPILLGNLGVREFTVGGKKHYVVSAGNVEGWDAERAMRDLTTFVEENLRFWGFLPYDKYLFLLMFRQGGGGLEHRNSNLSTVVAKAAPRPGANPDRWPSLGLLAHEYFHLFNVKRLRPVELGPFDFEKAPITGNLWISEGLTSYYSGLLMTRSGLQTQEEYLRSLSSLIGGLQNSPGRLLQSVERSSLEVWNNSNSGVNPNATTVSYYNKGNVLGLLLDAKIRRLSDGRKSFDDLMRVAYQRFGGERGFTAEEFRMTAESVAGAELKEWFARSVSSTEELDYSDLLEWYGLQFTESSGGTAGNWKLEVRPDQTERQRRNLQGWLGPSRR